MHRIEHTGRDTGMCLSRVDDTASGTGMCPGHVLAEWVYICMIGLLFLLIFFTAVKRTYSLPYMEGPNASRASISSYRVVTV
ncbi:hypothetical protein F383_04443 [Gossypium arboreum]|uniref:Uncharacterized protein n=1 Tax=Gossypium arboreum TaxID=29729 RepID=A0A0B0PLQ8_GOSAR|nr:hypothetical protein F383_04443 [Gossypium arboreum]